MNPRPARNLEWSTPLQMCRLILRGTTFPTAGRISLIVGTILTTVNQGAVLVHGEATAVTWVRTAVNYLVPYTVASIGYLSPFRRRDAP